MPWPDARRLKRAAAVGLALVAAAAIGGARLLGLWTWESHLGYFDPAFSPDGRYVFAVVRDTQGVTWGPGWEFFTPPAHTWAIRDQIRLVRVDVSEGRSETLDSFPSTPIVRRIIREYRGRVFATIHAAVRPESANAVGYSVELTIPAEPFSETYAISGVWSRDSVRARRSGWARGSSIGVSEPVVVGDAEVFAVSGPEAFPSALVLLDHRTMTARPIASGPAYPAKYPRGVPIAELLPVSRKADVDRLARFKAKENEFIAARRAEGLPEIDARLRSIRDLEDAGYLPRSPRLVARPIDDAASAGERPVFEIADAEMASGIFQDIEKAIAAPGTEVEKSFAPYVIHRDYDNSRKLNAYLAGGGRVFGVRVRDRFYRMEIR